MNNKLELLKDILLMGPGPSSVHASVYQALSKPTIGHLAPEFIDLMDDIKLFLQKLMNTKNQLTIPISGTGSAGMESCFVNLIEPNDKVLVLVNGVFGGRMVDVATRLGANVDSLNFEWGKPVDIKIVNKKLCKRKYNIVAVVHAETSTGVCNPIIEIGDLVKKNGALYLVDCVTSLGGINIQMDTWNIDALYSGTQKCLSCPPGLSPVSLSSNAIRKLQNRKNKVPNWYLDLTMITQYWSGKNRVYHHTAPINMMYGLYQACINIFDEGLQNVIKRHSNMHRILVKELEELGLEFFVEKQSRLPMLNAIKIPKHLNDLEIRKIFFDKYKIEIGGGLGPLSNKIWRIGLMGETAKEEGIQRLVNAFKKVL